jgi:hypothetical protein
MREAANRSRDIAMLRRPVCTARRAQTTKEEGSLGFRERIGYLWVAALIRVGWGLRAALDRVEEETGAEFPSKRLGRVREPQRVPVSTL